MKREELVILMRRDFHFSMCENYFDKYLIGFYRKVFAKLPINNNLSLR